MKTLNTPTKITTNILIKQHISTYTHKHDITITNTTPIHDALYTTYLIKPKIINTQHLHIYIETQKKYTIKHTIINTHTHNNLPPNYHITLQTNTPLFIQQLIKTFTQKI